MNSEALGGPVEDKRAQRLIARAAQRLGQAGLGHWEAAACEWMGRFAGIERYADAPEIAPARCVLRLVLRYVRTRTTPSDVGVADDLSALRFTQWHALWPAWATSSGRVERWRPLEREFAAFARRCADSDALVVWEGTLPVVSRAEAAAFLLARLARSGYGPQSDSTACADGG